MQHGSGKNEINTKNKQNRDLESLVAEGRHELTEEKQKSTNLADTLHKARQEIVVLEDKLKDRVEEVATLNFRNRSVQQGS